MKDEAASLPKEAFSGLKPKIYSFLVDDSREYKKAKGVNNNFVAKLLLNKDVLLSKKCLRFLINKIQSKRSKIGTKKSKNFHCLALMIKSIFLVVDLTH